LYWYQLKPALNKKYSRGKTVSYAHQTVLKLHFHKKYILTLNLALVNRISFVATDGRIKMLGWLVPA
jgi:hypothetical protein